MCPQEETVQCTHLAPSQINTGHQLINKNGVIGVIKVSILVEHVIL